MSGASNTYMIRYLQTTAITYMLHYPITVARLRDWGAIYKASGAVEGF